jgi:hypothetical protein
VRAAHSLDLLTARAAERQLVAAGFAIEAQHRSGVYLPLLAEIGGTAALAAEQRLEGRLRGGPFHWLLWTQYYVARRSAA